MDLALRRLQSCHMVGNWGSPDRCSLASRPQVQASATAAAANAPPVTVSQRALLQTAVRRNRGAQQQQQQQQQQQGANNNIDPAIAGNHIQQRLSPELRNNMLRAHQLELEEFQQLMAEHERRQQLQQKMRQQQQQQTQSPPPSKTAAGEQLQLLPDQHHQQQQQDQQQQQAWPPVADGQTEAAKQLVQRQLLQQQLALHQLLKQQQQRKRQLQLQLRREPAVLTTLIKHSTSWQRLQQLFTSLTPLFNPIHVSATITHLAQLQPHPRTPAQLAGMPPEFQQLVQQLTAAAVACIPDFGPRQLSNSMWAISRLGASELVTHKLRNDFLAAFADKLQFAAPQHVAIMLAAVVNMGWGADSLWQRKMMEAATLRLPYFNPPELAILLHAVSRSNTARPSPQWVSGVLDACQHHMQSFSMQELSMLAVSLTRLQHRPQQDWLVAFVRATQLQLAGATGAGAGAAVAAAVAGGSARQQHAGHSDSHSSSNNGSGEGVAGESAAAAAAAAGGSSAGDQEGSDLLDTSDSYYYSFVSREVKVQGVVSMLWALAKWGVVPPGGWHACCLAAVEHLGSDLTLQGASTLLWSFAKLQLQVPSRLVLQLLAHCQPLLPQATATDLAMLAWALGTMRFTAATLAAQVAAPDAELGAAAAYVGVQAGVAHPLRSSGGAAGFMHVGTAAADGSDTAVSSSSRRSYRRHRSSGSGCSGSWGAEWLRDFVYHSYRALPAATAADVASLLVGVVRMGLSPGDQWLAAAQVEAAHRLPAMLPVELTSTLLCLARLHAKPTQSFLDAYCSRSQALLTATAAAAGNTRRRFVRLGKSSKSSSAAAASSQAQFAAAAATAADARHYAPQSLANTLGALAMLGYCPPEPWCAQFFAASAALLPRFSGRDFAYTIWALALLELRPAKAWMDAYLVQLRGHVAVMTSQQLSAVIWALARLKHRPGVDWMQRFLDRVAALSTNTPQAAGGAGVAAGMEATPQQQQQDRADGMHAPPSPVQLSGYFSGIILQGLTAWCLELGFDGRRSSSGTRIGQNLNQQDGFDGGGSSTQPSRRRRTRGAGKKRGAVAANLSSDGCSGGGVEAVSVQTERAVAVGQDEAVEESVEEQGSAEVEDDSVAGSSHSRTVTSDGGILFRF